MFLILFFVINCSQLLEAKKFLGSEIQINDNMDENQNELMKFAEDKEDKHTLFYYHKWCNFIAWGVLADFGIISNRYGLLSQYRLLLHSFIMGLCVIPTVIAEVLMILFWNPPQFYGNMNLATLHAPIGFTFLGLMIIQGAGGVVLKLCVESKDQQNYIQYQTLFHVYLGYTLYFVGKIQCSFGFYEVYAPIVGEGQTNLIIFWIIYSLIFFWRIIFEWLYFNGKLYQIISKKDIDNKQDNVKDSMLVQCILQNDISTLERDFSDQMWFIFNNQIVNLTGFVHPGGQYIWEKTKGREISRFIYGGQGLEDGSCRAYKHSEKAIILLNQKTIGDLNHNNHLLQTKSFFIEQNEVTNNIWQLASVNKITDNISQFNLKSQSIKISNETKNLHSFGRYFQIQSTKNSKITIRQYTQLLCMAFENQLYRSQLISLIQNPQISENHLKNLNKPAQFLNELPLIIKKYQSNNGFSQYIHSQIEKEFQLQGPFGPALPLTRSSNIVLVCGGTGIFPFLDLLDFLLQTIIYQIISDKIGKEKAKTLNPFEFDFDHNIKITLIFAVQNQQELIGSDIYLTLLKIQKYLKEQRFNMIFKIKEKVDEVTCVDERFSSTFFRNYLGSISQFDSFFICGPPAMTKVMPQAFKELGVQQSKIHFI